MMKAYLLYMMLAKSITISIYTVLYLFLLQLSWLDGIEFYFVYIKVNVFCRDSLSYLRRCERQLFEYRRNADSTLCDENDW